MDCGVGGCCPAILSPGVSLELRDFQRTGGPGPGPFTTLADPLPQFTNRCLLKWLKLWDPVVFGRERPAQKPVPSVESARASKEAPGAAGKWKSHEQVLEEMLDAELEPSGRPRQKVHPPGGLWHRTCPLRSLTRPCPVPAYLGSCMGLGPSPPELPLLLQVALLCGPPGLGKTTLAHVIAQHAGYCVVEMNARYVCKSGTSRFSGHGAVWGSSGLAVTLTPLHPTT